MSTVLDPGPSWGQVLADIIEAYQRGKDRKQQRLYQTAQTTAEEARAAKYQGEAERIDKIQEERARLSGQLGTMASEWAAAHGGDMTNFNPWTTPEGYGYAESAMWHMADTTGENPDPNSVKALGAIGLGINDMSGYERQQESEERQTRVESGGASARSGAQAKVEALYEHPEYVESVIAKTEKDRANALRAKSASRYTSALATKIENETKDGAIKPETLRAITSRVNSLEKERSRLMTSTVGYVTTPAERSRIDSRISSIDKELGQLKGQLSQIFGKDELPPNMEGSDAYKNPPAYNRGSGGGIVGLGDPFPAPAPVAGLGGLPFDLDDDGDTTDPSEGMPDEDEIEAQVNADMDLSSEPQEGDDAASYFQREFLNQMSARLPAPMKSGDGDIEDFASYQRRMAPYAEQFGDPNIFFGVVAKRYKDSLTSM